MKLEIGKRYLLSNGVTGMLLCFLETAAENLAAFKGKAPNGNEYVYSTKQDGGPVVAGGYSVVKEYKETIKVTTYHRISARPDGGFSCISGTTPLHPLAISGWRLVKEWEETHEIEVE